ncbi:hypothetical protein TNCT_494651 [Trichonephila clavata]|uniref:Uncharacterized protein n=1 Tax=Trichonephila clavata TaxID=2740835 RepID=A0A8X6KNK1_TRICU|nr:hypothetical protein TNCT_494651 [Trichonephila clavata]
MVTTDSFTSSCTSLNHRSIVINMGTQVTGISSLNSFISNGSDLGRWLLSFSCQDIHGNNRFQENTKAQSSLSFSEQGLGLLIIDNQVD